MNIETVARNFPMVTAVLLYALVFMQVGRRRTRSWTEMFFVLSMFSGGTFALFEFLYYKVDSPELAVLANQSAFTALDFAILFLILFTVSFRRRANRRWLFLVPLPLVVLYLVWTWMVEGVALRPWGWVVEINAGFILPWIVYSLLYAFGGTVHIYKAYTILQGQSKALALRTFGLLLSFIFYILAGIIVVGLAGAAAPQVIPIFSILMFIPSLATIPIVFPGIWEKWVAAVRSQERRRHEVMGVTLMYEDGTLIGTKSMFSSGGLDLEVLSKTLALIQHFVKTSFPGLSGDSLRALDHEGLRIVIEKGEHTCLALILKGRENDFLRRQMKDALEAFESKNDFRLVNGLGTTPELRDTARTLDTFFAKESMF